MKRSTKNLVKWILYSVILFVFTVIQTTPGLLQINGVKPVLILPLAVFVAVFEGETGGFCFAVAAGIVWDSVSDKPLGFSAILLAVCCVIIALLVIFFVKASILNCCILCLAAVCVYCFFDFLFFYAIWGAGGLMSVLLTHFLPMIIYTTVISPLVFLLVRVIASKYNEILRV